MTYQMRVAEDGRLIPPEELARELDLKPGDSLTIDREDGRLVLRATGRALADIRAAVRASLPPDWTGSLVDELIAERRREAAKDDADFERWRRDETAE